MIQLENSRKIIVGARLGSGWRLFLCLLCLGLVGIHEIRPHSHFHISYVQKMCLIQGRISYISKRSSWLNLFIFDRNSNREKTCGRTWRDDRLRKWRILSPRRVKGDRRTHQQFVLMTLDGHRKVSNLPKRSRNGWWLWEGTNRKYRVH